MTQGSAPRRIGSHANLWDNAAVAIGGLSGLIELEHAKAIIIFGNVSAAVTFEVQGTSDGNNFYKLGDIVLAGAGNFSTAGIADSDRWGRVNMIRLKSNAAVTVTATLTGKP